MPPTSLRTALAARIQRVANQPVTAADFELERVPDHLQVSFRVVDERGRAVGSDRDLRRLQQRFSDRARASVARAPTDRSPGSRKIRDASTSSATAGPGASGADGRRRSRVRRAHRPHRLGLRRPARRRRHEGRGRGRPRLPGARRRGLERRPARGGDPGGRRARDARRRAAAAAAGRPVAGVVCARAPHLGREARPRGIPLPVREERSSKTRASRWRMPSSRAPRDPSAVRTRADFERVRDALSAAVVDETFQTVSLAAAS